MPLSAKKQTVDAVRRLNRYVKDSRRSMREIAQMTMGLDPPERMHHTHLSTILNNKPNRNIYLQQYLCLLNILGLPATAMIADFDDPADARLVEKIVCRLAELPRGTRARVLAAVDAVIKQSGASR